MSCGKIIVRIAHLLNRFDIFHLFEYTPKFFIKQKKDYKSTVGSFAMLVYTVFSLWWIYSNFYEFLSSYDEIKVLNDFLTTSKVRHINTEDFYFGVGLKDENGIPMMMEDLPGLEIQIKSFNNYSPSKISNSNLTACDAGAFFVEKDWNQIKESLRDDLTNLIASFFLCPDENFNTTLFPKNWMNNTGYFEMLIKITNLSMLNSTMNLIKLKRPSFELVWSSFALKFNNFTDPLNTFIDSTHGYFLNNIVSTSEVTITPMIIIDNNPLNSKEMNPFQIGTNQPDGAEFFISKETIINEDVFDRSISTANDENLIFKR